MRREYPTDIGPVDLLCRDADGVAVAVEVKRRGEIDGVEQLTRYLERLDRDPVLRPVRGVFVAQQIKPQAKVLAADRGIACVEVDYDELRGIESDELSCSELGFAEPCPCVQSRPTERADRVRERGSGPTSTIVCAGCGAAPRRSRGRADRRERAARTTAAS